MAREKNKKCFSPGYGLSPCKLFPERAHCPFARSGFLFCKDSSGSRRVGIGRELSPGMFLRRVETRIGLRVC